jgi:hypothetical protein
MRVSSGGWNDENPEFEEIVKIYDNSITIYNLIKLALVYDVVDSILFHKEDDETLTAAIKCSDLFCLAQADCEEITKEDFDDFEQALKDAAEAERFTVGPSLKLSDEKLKHWNPIFGDALWCARKRKMRPHPSYYSMFESYPKLIELFDACGPVRETSSE